MHLATLLCSPALHYASSYPLTVSLGRFGTVSSVSSPSFEIRGRDEVRWVMQENHVWKAAGSTDEGRDPVDLFDDDETELTREGSRDPLCWFPAERLPDRWNGKDHGGTCATSALARSFLSHIL
jgi:hypothetical protein